MDTRTSTEPRAEAMEIPEVKPRVDHRLSVGRRLRKEIGAALEYLWELSGSARLYKCDAVLLEGQEKGDWSRFWSSNRRGSGPETISIPSWASRKGRQDSETHTRSSSRVSRT